MQTHCEDCDHFIYDDQIDCYVCEIDVDMDDAERMASFSEYCCPYYKFNDEYAVVRKQN